MTNNLQEHIELLSTSKRMTVKEFENLNTFDGMALYREFEEQKDGIIQSAESMTGAHITQEGIKNKIREDLQALADRTLEEIDSTVSTYEGKKQALLENLNKSIYKAEEMTGDQANQIALRNSELQGEIRGTLYRLNTADNVEREFLSLADRAEYDKTLARFLSKNYYLFADRVKEINASEMEKDRAIFRISQAADQLEKSAYTDKHRALLALKEATEQKTFGGQAAKRLIQNNTPIILSRYK